MREPLALPAWHLESMSWFYQSGLPALLHQKLPLETYDTRRAGHCAVDVELVIASTGGPVTVVFDSLPLPDGSGVFHVDGRTLVVVPIAESEALDACRILCAGEQLSAFLDSHLGGAPTRSEWDEHFVRDLVPLETLIREFLLSTGQELDTQNWYSRATHLRRLLNPRMRTVMPDSHKGRVCPIDTPNQPEKTGRVLTLARGARITSGTIALQAGDPVDCLGPVTALVPFLDRTAPVRAQMGVQLMRQWRMAAHPEPALVQTGLEPEEPGSWLGCNLLTAFMSRGKETYEDSLLLSESAAARMGFSPIDAVGTLLSNRHGQKGVVGRVLADAQMPPLPDGSPVDIVVSFIGLHTRMNTGQVFEAMVSWAARREGIPFLAPPFAVVDQGDPVKALPDAPYLQRLGRSAAALDVEQEVTVGWVYWGACVPHAAMRLKTCSHDGPAGCMRQGEMENHVLKRCRAYLTIQEHLTTLSAEKKETTTWSVLFDTLVQRLSSAGIAAEIAGSGLSVRFVEPGEGALRLASPLRHPWLPERTIRAVGPQPGVDGWDELERANQALVDARSISGNLASGRIERLQSLLDAYFSRLLTPDVLRLGSRVLKSGRGVIAVAADLACDEAGIPSRMARDLFSDAGLPEWVIINRAPTMETTAITAFHPVIVEGDAVLVNPFVCRWLDADFDGDMVAVLVPGTSESQEEAGRLLSVVGHVTAEPASLETLAPNGESMWGLARLWLSREGKEELLRLLPALSAHDIVLTRDSLVLALRQFLLEADPGRAVDKAVQLWERGFAEALRLGGTLDPIALAAIPLPTMPRGEDREDWMQYEERCVQGLASVQGFAGRAMECQVLAVCSRARGDAARLARLVSGSGYQEDRQGRSRIIRSGLLSGMSFDDYVHLATIDNELTIESLALWSGQRHPGFPEYRPYVPAGSHVVARAMRSPYPGMVFAAAAAAGETDPLTDIDARLFVGLLP